jgi:hypothetical protein
VLTPEQRAEFRRITGERHLPPGLHGDRGPGGPHPIF